MKALVCSLIAAVSLVTSASAAVVSYDYVASDGSGGSLTGAFTFDTSIAPTSSSSIVATYAGATTSFLISGGLQDGGAGSVSLGEVVILDQTSVQDGFLLREQGATSTADFSIRLVSSNAALFSNTSLPISLSLSDFDFATIRVPDVFLGFSGGNTVDYQITSLTQSVAAIPLPASLPLLAVALGGIGIVARRRKSV